MSIGVVGVDTSSGNSSGGTVTSVSGTANQINVANPTSTPVLSFPTNGIIANNVSPGLLSTATAAGTTTLTVASKGIQVFTGATTQTIVLPVVTTLPQLGFGFVIQNDSSGALTVNSSGGNLVQTMAAGTRAFFTCKLLTGTDAASWNVSYLAGGTIGGSSGSVDRGLVLANGTGGSTVQGSATTLSSAGVFGFVNNQRQIFSPGSQRAGLNVGSVGADPSIQSNGDIWYNTTAFQLRAIVNGSVVNIGGGGTIGGSGTLNTIPKFSPDGTHLVDSSSTDDGATIHVGGNTSQIVLGSSDTLASSVQVLNDADGNIIIDSGATGTVIGDPNGKGNNTTLTVSDGAQTITSAAGVAVILTTPKFQISNTIAGGTGAQTINQSAGQVQFAAAATSLVVTNSTVSATSIIIATVASNDTTFKSCQVVAASGSFTIFANAAATGTTKVNFWVIN